LIGLAENKIYPVLVFHYIHVSLNMVLGSWGTQDLSLICLVTLPACDGQMQLL